MPVVADDHAVTAVPRVFGPGRSRRKAASRASGRGSGFWGVYDMLHPKESLRPTLSMLIPATLSQTKSSQLCSRVRAPSNLQFPGKPESPKPHPVRSADAHDSCVAIPKGLDDVRNTSTPGLQASETTIALLISFPTKSHTRKSVISQIGPTPSGNPFKTGEYREAAIIRIGFSDIFFVPEVVVLRNPRNSIEKSSGPYILQTLHHPKRTLRSLRGTRRFGNRGPGTAPPKGSS